MPPDWQGQQGGAADCRECVTSLSLSLHSLLFLLHFHPFISHQRLPGRHGAIIVSHSNHPVSLFGAFTCGSALNPISTPPVARPRLIFPFFHPMFLPLPSCCSPAASSRVPDLLINNCAALSQHFLLLSMFFTLKLMSDRASIFTGLHHSGGATPSCTSLSSPPTTSLHRTCSSIPRSLFPPTSALTKKFHGHPIFFS